MLTLPPLLWAGNAVVGRLLVGVSPPLELSALRWLLALVLLLPLGWRALQDPAQLLVRWKYLSLLGLVGVGSFNALHYLAVHSSTPLNTTLIAASSPVWMMAVGALFYGVQPQPKQITGACLSMAGVALVLSRGQFESLLAMQLVIGDLLMLLAIALWAVYSWLLAQPPAHMRGAQRPPWGWAEFLLVQVLFGLVWAGAAAGVEAVVWPEPTTWSATLAAALLFLAVGPSIVAYWCWGKGVSTVGPAVAAFFGNLTPLFTAVLSTVMLGEIPRWYHAGAFALIVAGIVVSSRSGQTSSLPSRA